MPQSEAERENCKFLTAKHCRTGRGVLVFYRGVCLCPNYRCEYQSERKVKIPESPDVNGIEFPLCRRYHPQRDRIKK